MLPREQLNALAADVTRLTRHSMLTFTCGVGRLLLDRLYGGSLDTWRARGPKDLSLRQLAELLDPEEGLSATGLSRCISIHETVERCGGVATCQHLGPSHVREVLALPQPKQKELLLRAEQEVWTVRELAEHVRRSPNSSHSRGGRPRVPTFLKSLRQLQRMTEEA